MGKVRAFLRQVLEVVAVVVFYACMGIGLGVLVGFVRFVLYG